MDMISLSKAASALQSLTEVGKSAALTQGPPSAGPHEALPLDAAVQQLEQALQAPPEDAAPQGAHAVEDMSQGPPATAGMGQGMGELTPTDLYQTQFVMGMLKTQGSVGSKGTQQLTQDMETLLKQQG